MRAEYLPKWFKYEGEGEAFNIFPFLGFIYCLSGSEKYHLLSHFRSALGDLNTEHLIHIWKHPKTRQFRNLNSKSNKTKLTIQIPYQYSVDLKNSGHLIVNNSNVQKQNILCHLNNK